MVLNQRAFSFHWFFKLITFPSFQETEYKSDHRFYAYTLLLSESFVLPSTHQHCQTMRLGSLSQVGFLSPSFYATVIESLFFFLQFCWCDSLTIGPTAFPPGLPGVCEIKSWLVMVPHEYWTCQEFWCVLFLGTHSENIVTWIWRNE